MPVALFGLEVILNFIQALIFSVLTLIFTLLAIESHEHEEGEIVDEGLEALREPTAGQAALACTLSRSQPADHSVQIDPAAGRE